MDLLLDHSDQAGVGSMDGVRDCLPWLPKLTLCSCPD
jgi:hypothetical protein